MSTREFRAAAVSRIVAWHSREFANLKLFHENGPTPDESTVGDTWIDTEFEWYSATLRAIGGARAPTRHSGDIVFMIYTREGLGSAPADRVIDSLMAEFARARIGRGYTLAPRRASPTTLLGWHKEGLYVPFVLDGG